MQIVQKNEDEGCIDREASIVGAVIYVRRISRHLERKCNGGPKEWKFGICDSRRISDRSEERIWWRRQ